MCTGKKKRFRGPTLQGSTFSRFGPPSFGAPPFGAPTVRGPQCETTGTLIWAKMDWPKTVSAHETRLGCHRQEALLSQQETPFSHRERAVAVRKKMSGQLRPQRNLAMLFSQVSMVGWGARSGGTGGLEGWARRVGEALNLALLFLSATIFFLFFPSVEARALQSASPARIGKQTC